jgi:hypothetical protein
MRTHRSRGEGKQVNLLMNPDELERLDLLARAFRAVRIGKPSRTEMIRMAIEQYIDHHIDTNQQIRDFFDSAEHPGLHLMRDPGPTRPNASST